METNDVLVALSGLQGSVTELTMWVQLGAGILCAIVFAVTWRA